MSRQVGHYVLGPEVARGGAGVVFRAVDARDGREVALKVMLDGDGGARRMLRFDREARALIRLRHPAIVAAYDTGVDAGRPWLAMELVQGESLQRHLDTHGPMAPAAAAELVVQLARAVEHAHQSGVLHRDLKPDNVLITRDGTPRLVDFGLARDLEPGEASRLTATGTVLGTPGYWAPEQARGERADARTDVYGLGGLLHAALVGAPPIEADSFTEALIAVEAREVEPPSGRRQGVDPALDAICLRALAKQRDDRYPAAGALADALEGWLAGPRPTAPRRRSPAALWLVGGAALAAAVAAALSVRGPDAAPAAPATEATTPSTEAQPVDALVAEALARLDRGDAAGAAAVLERALAREPDHAGALAARGLARAGRPGEALDDATRAAAAPPRDAATWLTIARVRLLAGERDAAEGAVGRALEHDPDLSAAWALRAEVRLALGRPEAARADAEQALALAPDDPGARLARARVAATTGPADDALADLDAALRAAPDHLAARLLRGDLRRRAGDLAGARADLDQAVEASPHDPAGWRARALARAAQRDPGALDDVARAEGLAPGLEHLAARGRVLGLLGRWEEALPDLQAVEAQRGDGDDLDALAACLLRLKRPRDAVALLDRAAKLEPDRAERWARLALTLAHLGDPAYGRTLAERALSLDPRSGLAICALGIARYHAGDRRGARVELDRGLALAVDPTALELRAQLRFNDGDWQGAVADLDRALALGPLEPARTYYNRGVFRSTPDPEAADADYDLALAADPRFLQALHARLGRRLRRGDYAGGRADVEAALKESPGDARLHYNLASLCRRLGDGDGALAAAARALELDPSMLHVHLTRGLVLLDRDQLPAALDEFGRSVAKAHDFASRGYALRALTRRRLGDLDGALDDAAQALALDPDEAAALTIRGLVRRARGERAAGDADLSRGLALAAKEDADLVRVLRIEVDR